MSLKDLYFSLEDKYYALLDKIDKHLPLYKIIEPIDKVFPSFILFLILIVLLVFLSAWFLLTSFGFTFPGAEAQLFIVVQDEDNFPLENVLVTVSYDDKKETLITDELGNTKAITVPVGTIVKVEISETGFEEFSDSFTVETLTFRKTITLASIKAEFIQRTLLLKNRFDQLISDELYLTFECVNPEAIPPAPQSVYNGRTTIEEPANCQGLIVNIFSENYEEKNSVRVTQDTQSIYLEELDTLDEMATVVVNLYFNGELVTDSITVSLYRYTEFDGVLEDFKTTETGRVEFSVFAGTYYVKTNSTTRFAVKESSYFSVDASETKEVNLYLEENVAGTIKLQILDEKTNKQVDNALVTLKKGKSELDNERTSADENAIVEFSVAEDIGYTIVVDHEDYCLKIVNDVRISSQVQKIRLKKYLGNESCGSTLKVVVLDEEGEPIENATVNLYSEDGYKLGFGAKLTDANGEAEFTRVPSGKYKAFAFKGSSYGWSDVEEFVQRVAEKTVLRVTLVIPDATVSVRVVDLDGNPLQFAEVGFFNAFNNRLIGSGTVPVQDVNGVLEFDMKADKSIYIIVYKKGYANFVSVPFKVRPNTVERIEAVMEPEIISGDLKVKFLGLYRDDKIVSVLAPGKEYTAKFQLRVPINRNYKRVGFHFRTGTKNTMELDQIYIKSLNVPGRNAVIKSTSFNPPDNYEEDSKRISSGNAKWLNIEWPQFTTGIINLEATVVVKETASSDDELKLFYRAYGISKENEFFRDPVDEKLGTSENVSGLQALYANAYSETYQVGIETICTDKFCFTASILDLKEDLLESVTDSYAAKIFQNYRLTFTILNNAEFDVYSYPNAELKFSNLDEAINLQKYEVYGAQNQKRDATLNAFESPWIDVGNFNPNETVSGTLYFSPWKTMNSKILIQIKSQQRIQFEEVISIDTEARKEFEVSISPSLLPSGVENEIAVTVKEKATDLEVKDAVVKIRDRFNNLLASRETSSFGIAKIKLPAQKPGEKLKLFVEKPEFKVFETELAVDDRILEMKPEKIGVSLNPKVKPSAEDFFEIENKTNFPLKITRLELVGNFDDYLDLEQMNNWLYSYVDDTMAEKKTKDFILRSYLSELGKNLEESKNLDGTLLLEVSNSDSWSFEIPVVVHIGIGGEVDDPTCFTITKSEWVAATEGSPISIQFEIKNNCSVEGNPVTLRDVRAKIVWESNHVGEFSLSTEDFSKELRSGYFRTIMHRMQPESSLSAILTFEPSAAVNGEAKAKIVFEATNPTDAKDEVLSAEIEAKLSVINLVDCISFSKEVLEMKRGEKDSFVVETLGCGNSTSFSLESDLTLSKKEFTLGDTDSKEIEVLAERNKPGMYPIIVRAKAAGQVEEKVIDVLRAKILSDGCIDLSKYEFDIFDDPSNPYDGYDTAELINRCYEKPVEIKVDTTNFMKALKEGAKWALMGAVLGYIGEKFGGGKEKVSSDSGRIKELEKLLEEKERKIEELQAQIDELKKNMPLTEEQQRQISVLEDEKNKIEEDKEKIEKELRSPVGYSCGYFVGTLCVEAGASCPQGYKPAPSYNKYCESDNCCTYVSSDETVSQYAEENGEPSEDNIGQDGAGGNQTKNESTDPCADTDCPEGYECVVEGKSAFCRPIQFPPFGGGGGNNGSEGDEDKIGDQGESGNKDEDVNLLASYDFDQTPTGLFDLLGLNLSGKGVAGNFIQTILFNTLGNIFGNPNPLTYGVWGWVIGTLEAYSAMGEITLTVIEKDLVVENLKLLVMAGLNEVEDTEISVDEIDERSVEADFTRPGTAIELTTIAFTNKNNVVQEDPYLPLSRILKVTGEKREYQTEYKGDNAPDELDVKEVKKYFEKFHLIFNSYKPVECGPDTYPCPKVGLKKCVLGNKKGVTGKDALPRIKFDWNWRDIEINECDESNPDYIYCDATQFSISLLKKIQEIKKFVETYGSSFKCPSTESATSVEEQELSSTGFDVGITKLQAIKEYTECNDVITELKESEELNDLEGAGSYIGKTVAVKLLEVLPDDLQATFSLIYNGQTIDTQTVSEGVLLNEKFVDEQWKYALKTAVKVVKIDVDAENQGFVLLEHCVKEEGTGNVSIVATVESNNNKQMSATVTMSVEDESGHEVGNCEKEISIISKSSVFCRFDLSNGRYDVLVFAAPHLCDGCENSDYENDELSLSVFIGETGLEQCEPYNTKRLHKFIEATEASGNAPWQKSEAEKILSYVKFNTHLIKDAYTKDFRKDFDDFSKTKSFFNAPSYYLESKGLGEFFSSEDRFVFDYAKAPNAALDAGKYSAEINVEFGNDSWMFFDKEKPDAIITVKLVQLSAPEPQSPFYYLPFDGLVGVDSENGRQGYGINYRQESERTVRINNEVDQVVLTTDIAGSNPIFGGWLKAGYNDKFIVLNKTNRGILLDVRAKDNETKLIFSPSYATPVKMNISHKAGKNAYGYYSIDVDNVTQTGASSMLPWTGLGYNCRDFEDAPLIDAFDNTWDSHGLERRCAKGVDETDYGIEWCNVKKNGNVYLHSVVFTPQDKESWMRVSKFSDAMSIGKAERNGNILDYVNKFNLNGGPGTEEITSVEDVFNLVKEEKACVVGAGSKISSQFFWNTAKLLEPFYEPSYLQEIEEKCIHE